MGDENIKSEQDNIACSFCNEKLPSSGIGNHLMTCGNKTDQCPNCKKYIRRAIFAYHYENNCANIEESDAAVNSILNETNIPPITPENPSSKSSAVVTNKNRCNRILTDSLPIGNTSHVSTSLQSETEIQTTYVCSYCSYECDIQDMEAHRENCLRNPKNMTKKEKPRTDFATAGISSNQTNQPTESSDMVDIPCDQCNQLIKWSDYHDHPYHCRAVATFHTAPRLASGARIDEPASTECQYCHTICMKSGIAMHERHCSFNPVNIDGRQDYYNYCCPFS